MRFFSSCTNAACILSLLLGPSGFAQEASGNRPHRAISPVSSGILTDGTPVKLRLSETISSATAHNGQEVPLEVVEEVVTDDVPVLLKGSIVMAMVTFGDHKKKIMGRGGELKLHIDSVRLADKENVQLRTTAGDEGDAHTGAARESGTLFFPEDTQFLSMRSKDITLTKGLETTAFVNGDAHLNLDMLAHLNAPQVIEPAAH